MSETAVSIRGLSLAIRGKPLLRDVSVEVGAGEVWSIIGANGAGKTTLLKCLLRMYRDWTGEVQVQGRNLRTYSQRDLAHRIAYVPQPGNEQHTAFTVRELVRMGRYAFSGPFGSAHAGDAEAIERALEQTRMSDFAGRTIGTLSGGERQKVFLASALAQGSEILLLDEPTAFLDYRHQADVAEILVRVNRESGTTIVRVTHDVNAAMVAGGRVLALRCGGPVWSGEAAALGDAEVLTHIFGAQFRLLPDPVTGLRLVAPQGGAV